MAWKNESFFMALTFTESYYLPGTVLSFTLYELLLLLYPFHRGGQESLRRLNNLPKVPINKSKTDTSIPVHYVKA